MNFKLTFLFDGKCPLCLREVNFLKNKDKLKFIKFVDISSPKYIPKDFENITYEEAMLNLHGILSNGDVLKGLDVLVFSYDLIGMGWVYSPTKITYLRPIFRFLYKFWARNRLKITGRENNLKLCNSNLSEFK